MDRGSGNGSHHGPQKLLALSLRRLVHAVQTNVRPSPNGALHPPRSASASRRWNGSPFRRQCYALGSGRLARTRRDAVSTSAGSARFDLRPRRRSPDRTAPGPATRRRPPAALGPPSPRGVPSPTTRPPRTEGTATRPRTRGTPSGMAGPLILRRRQAPRSSRLDFMRHLHPLGMPVDVDPADPSLPRQHVVAAPAVRDHRSGAVTPEHPLDHRLPLARIELVVGGQFGGEAPCIPVLSVDPHRCLVRLDEVRPKHHPMDRLVVGAEALGARLQEPLDRFDAHLQPGHRGHGLLD